MKTKILVTGGRRVLVTGGAGFIGSHVVDALIKRGYKALVMDNLAPPVHDGKIPKWLNKKAEFFKGDVREKKDWTKAIKDIGAVIHLAAYMDYHPDFSTYIRTNLESVALLFELILEKKLPIKKIVYASSQSVYGHGKYSCKAHGEIYVPPRAEADLEKSKWEYLCKSCGKHLTHVPQKEDDKLSPQIPYGISKMAGEELLMNLGKRYGVPVAISRVSIALGPRQSFKHFYSGALRAFAVNVLNSESIKMNEDGQQSRDFIDVRDVASAYLKVLEDPRADFQIFNFGSGEETRVIDLAKMVSEEAGIAFNPSLKNRYRRGDTRRSLMDVSKLKNLDWAPRHTIREAVKECLEWMRQFGNLKDTLDKNYSQLNKEGVLRNWSA